MIKPVPQHRWTWVNGKLVSANSRCWFCGCVLFGRPQHNPNFRTVEHLQPLSRGGSRLSKENLVWACKKCNNSKSALTLEEYRTKCHIQLFWGEEQAWSYPTKELQLLYQRQQMGPRET